MNYDAEHMIGEFEYRVLAAISHLGDDAYGASVRRLLGEQGKVPSIGALYTTIDRLESKAMIRTWMGESTPERGGRAKRMLSLTPAGVRAGKSFFDAIMQASRKVAWARQP